MATTFKCEPGKVLSGDEEQDLQAYKDAGIAPPDAYNDVVFDNTSPRGAVYRCKTAAEKSAEADMAKAAQEGEARRERRNAILRDAGVDPATGVALGAAGAPLSPVDLDPNADKKADDKKADDKK